MNNPQVFIRSNRLKQRRIISVSMIMLSLCLLVPFILASCGYQNKTGSQSSTQGNNQPGTNTPAGDLTGLHMINAMVGWAVSWDALGSGAYTILRTTDGGSHWSTTLKCKPTESLGMGYVEGCSTNFRSASIATVVQPEYDSKTQVSQLRIFHSSDGGQNWQSAVIKARDLETSPVFVDALHGWELVTDNFPGPDPGSAYIGKEIALFHTNDGGRTWQKIAGGPSTSQLPVTSDDAYGIPPLTASTRMQFVTPATGWLTGTSSHQDSSDYSWLYVTHDSGATWQPVTLPFPPGSLIVWPPQFFTEQDGLLSVLTSGPNSSGTALYTTHDGGKTWTQTAVPFDVTSADFIDMNHALAMASDSRSKMVYTTSDGWHHWTQLHLNAPFQLVYNFSFVSPTLGWALANNITRTGPPGSINLRKGDTIAMLKTTDGGKTWQEIAHSVV
ncbi:MAG TPA: hypothetical protein VFA09_21555 [Ktedonobacteraceae bacterium]|nr:hypothetical protein [Ktedonobacteraceae bacterium]